ncbi:unnamed protein product [Caenorhabditis auriculariae]|uniref:Uncharacterized protein n=1 Tax=Caenorhabditis auriculariae TaxID=2777116 RepID=A0A8S1HLN6_9PELO|nr:unnamed protein product [Caenorhabditis auriculariae]
MEPSRAHEILEGKASDLEQTRVPPTLRPFIKEKLWNYSMRKRAPMDEVVKFLKKTYRNCKKLEGLPKTTTNEESTGGKGDGSFNNALKNRRREPVSRNVIMEQVCPTKED